MKCCSAIYNCDLLLYMVNIFLFGQENKLQMGVNDFL